MIVRRLRGGALIIVFVLGLWGLLQLDGVRPVAARSQPRAQGSAPTACEPAQPITVTATPTLAGLELSWPHYQPNWYYEIYHGTTPYFPLSEQTHVDTVVAPVTNWVDADALLTSGNDYYLVKAQGCGGDKVNSNRAGTYTYAPPLPGTLFGEIHTGEATYYNADGTGNCMFPAAPDDIYVAALDLTDYGPDARYCGATIRVWGPYGDVQVRVVDSCPDTGCLPGHVDLHPEAFKLIAPERYGRVPIQWQLVSPPIEGDIVYHFKDASNPWWAAIQVRNHRNPLARLEVLQNGRWTELPRAQYNHFVAAQGLGNGPFTFRVTDVFGNQIVTEGVPLMDNGSWPGGDQFPQLQE